MPWSSFSKCWALSPLFHSPLSFIKRLFSSSSLSAIRVVSSAYLRLLIFLLAILIPACASSSPAFLMMYSAYKLNKQGDHMQPWRTPFPIWNQSVVPCPVLTGLLILIYANVQRTLSLLWNLRDYFRNHCRTKHGKVWMENGGPIWWIWLYFGFSQWGLGDISLGKMNHKLCMLFFRN